MSKAKPSLSGPFAAILDNRTRVHTRASGVVTAAEAIGPIEQNATLVGITKAEFSSLDIVEHVLNATGPADIAISTWTMGIYDADALWHFRSLGNIRSIRFLVDPSFFGRQVELAKPFIDSFGVENIRAFANHAKFTLVANDEWTVTIIGSMNLNRNKRLENFMLTTDPVIHEFHRGIVDQVFSELPPYSSSQPHGKAMLAKMSIGPDGGGNGGRQPEIW